MNRIPMQNNLKTVDETHVRAEVVRSAEIIKRISENGTVGDYTWTGVLYDFLTRVRQGPGVTNNDK